MYSNKLFLLSVAEKDSEYECCVALLDGADGLAYIKKLLSGRVLKNCFLLWDEIDKASIASEQIHKGQLVHLIFLTALTTPGEFSLVYPGQNLIEATLEEEYAALVLEEERKEFVPELIQLWSLPVGWVAPGLEDFLDRNSE